MLMDKIRQPGDLKRLPERMLPKLAEELRAKMIETTAVNGGHLASSLGVVELTIVLHRIFSLPKDHIVWDVGHQTYAHKLLTGRADRFDTLRRPGGISGFPKSAESPYDAFVAGHSSTSISAALGIAAAKKMRGDSSYTVAVIGDGALSGGMAYEGLNNAGRFEGNIIVILNDNERSISKNTGSMARYLASVRNRPEYYEFKDFVEKNVRKTPVVGEKMRNLLSRSKKVLKETLYPSTFFEELGFTYLGPVNGHDFKELESVLRRARTIDAPVFVHVHTIKGKGYPYAEKNPGAFHGVSSFDAETGKMPPSKPNFSAAAGRTLTDLASEDDSIVAITAAMKQGTGLAEFAKAHPKRFFDVGIAEEHAATFAGGLAAGGMHPVFAVYSTFLQRAYDQVLHDLAIEKRHVVLAVDRAGVVGEDGETHQGLFDAAYLSTIPGTTIYSPSCFSETEYCLKQALYNTRGIAAVRYPRGGEMAEHRQEDACEADHLLLKQGKTDTLLISYGRVADSVFAAARELNGRKICCDALKLVRIAPLSGEVKKICAGYRRIFFFEEGIRTGGIGEQLMEQLNRIGWSGFYFLRAVDGFVHQNTVSGALRELGLDKESISAAVTEQTR